MSKLIILLSFLIIFIGCNDSFQEEARVIQPINTTTPDQSPTNNDQTTPPATTGSPIRSGSFVGRNGYNVSGDVEVFFDPITDMYSIILADNFITEAGPDLRVYLSQDSGVTLNATNLGVLSSNSGSLRYDIPASQYDASFNKVLIWCEDFSVLFAEASI